MIRYPRKPGVAVRCAGVLGLCLSLASPLSCAEAWGLDALMRELSLNRGGRARFEEKKYIGLLEKPVESTGELVYRAPDHLEKNTATPERETLTLDGDSLVVERENARRSLSLRDYPEIAAFVESIRGALAGDRKALERTYLLALEGGADRWQLILTPLDEELAAQISRIVIGGKGNVVDAMTIQQTDGDRSVMRILPLPRPESRP